MRDLDGPFEHIERDRLQQLKDKFSKVVFTPSETDEREILIYMNSFFEDDASKKLLEIHRGSVKAAAKALKGRTAPFTVSTLKMCIKGLLTNDLLNDAAKMTLSEFSQNDIVLSEIADVLNLRYSDLDNWSWEADDGMYYEPRRQANGKYRIMMDQNILQAIFLHYVAVSWCSEFKELFQHFVLNSHFWRKNEKMTTKEQARYHYFRGQKPLDQGVEYAKGKTFWNTFFLSSLPASLEDGSDPYGEDRTGKPTEGKSGLGIRQVLLRQVATDVLLDKSLKGKIAVVQSDLQWYATGLPHSTLFAIMKFWGIPEDWMNFFKKFAQAPLRMDEASGSEVRIRRRGIPITDAFEKLFGECVLFAMDVAVNRSTGMTLYRFHDDLWLSGDPQQCAAAWKSIENFVRVLGLSINEKKTGSVYLCNGEKDPAVLSALPAGDVSVGMLKLTDTGEWAIDQSQVDAHIRQLQKQLGQCKSILSWVQTWNACMGRFFQDTFGKPANCFGQAHVNAILETHARMQRELFDDTASRSVTEYLRGIIARRLGVEDVPDCFFFLPEEFGGLGLKNPFIPFLVIRDQLMKNPNTYVPAFEEWEYKTYLIDKAHFDELSEIEKRRRAREIFDEDEESCLGEPFYSFEEYTLHRERYSLQLLKLWKRFIQQPDVKDIKLTNDLKPMFDALKHSHAVSWADMTSEQKWVMHLYAGELLRRFGALSIVDQNLLPSGVMRMLRKKKVTWQLILWD